MLISYFWAHWIDGVEVRGELVHTVAFNDVVYIIVTLLVITYKAPRGMHLYVQFHTQYLSTTSHVSGLWGSSATKQQSVPVIMHHGASASASGLRSTLKRSRSLLLDHIGPHSLSSITNVYIYTYPIRWSLTRYTKSSSCSIKVSTTFSFYFVVAGTKANDPQRHTKVRAHTHLPEHTS